MSMFFWADARQLWWSLQARSKTFRASNQVQRRDRWLEVTSVLAGSRLQSLLKRVKSHELSRNAGWIFGGQVVGFVLQAVFFVIVARILGVTEYGRFAGALALTTILMPYSALGGGMLFMRYVTKARDAAQVYWGNCLITIAAMSSLIAVSCYLLAPLLRLSTEPVLVLVLVVANCLFTQIVLCASAVFQTLNHFRVTATLRLLPNLLRLIALLVMRPMWHHANAVLWSFGVLGSAVVAAMISMLWVRASIGPARFDLRLARKRLLEGGGFSFAGCTQSAYNDVDKAMLSRYGMNAENGIYTLAYRVIDIACTPVQAIDGAALPRYFNDAQSSFAAVVGSARRLIPAALFTGLAMGICAVAGSSFVPKLAGRGFGEVVVAIRLLSLLPMLRGIHQLAGGAVTGAGFQRYRTGGQLVVALTNVGLNLWLIPRFGWHGAAWASLASDGALGVINVSILLWLQRVLMPVPQTVLAMDGVGR